MIRVLFVCLGNICRSPTAEGVFRDLVQVAGLEHAIEADSAGTYAYHEGEPPDARSQAAARARGYSLETLRGRRVVSDDFDEFDYVLAMDASNLQQLKQLQPDGCRAKLGLFLSFVEGREGQGVPDPYAGGADGFERVLDLIEDGCGALISHLMTAHGLVEQA